MFSVLNEWKMALLRNRFNTIFDERKIYYLYISNVEWNEWWFCKTDLKEDIVYCQYIEHDILEASTNKI